MAIPFPDAKPSFRYPGKNIFEKNSESKKKFEKIASSEKKFSIFFDHGKKF